MKIFVRRNTDSRSSVMCTGGRHGNSKYFGMGLSKAGNFEFVL